MSVHEDLLNNGENNCSFTEDEVDIMCSKDGDAAYRMCDVIDKKFLTFLTLFVITGNKFGLRLSIRAFMTYI